MSLLLSRLQLNPFSRHALSMIAGPREMHDAVYILFTKEESGRILFRVDTEQAGPTVLIQSAVEPNWGELKLAPSDLRTPPASRPISVATSVGTELSFRLLARPTRVASTGKGNPHGPRRDIRTDEERLAWLHRKGKDAGFQITTCGLTIFSFAAVKTNVSFRENGGSFTACQFDGDLVVTDPGKLCEAVAKGIGTQKAYGFGLLSLSRGGR